MYTSAEPSSAKEEKKKAIDSPYFHRLQRRHFILYDVLPGFGVLAAIALAFYVPVTAVDLSLFLLFWCLTGLGVTVGYHRLFTHRSFKAAKPVAILLTILGSMAGQGALLSWVAMHRRHHELSDKEGDPHSPNLHGAGVKGAVKGLLHSHYLWMRQHEYPNVVYYAPDLLRDKAVVAASRKYTQWVLLGLALPTVLGGVLSGSWMGCLTGFLWGGAVRLFVLGHTIWSINSFLHRFGFRPYQSRDHSRNAGFLGWLTFGESFHNNHHAFPESPSFGLQWALFDPGYWFIKSLALLGLASELRVPGKARRTSRKQRNVTH